MSEDPRAADLVRGAIAREPAAVARAISLVEDRRPPAEARTIELLAGLRSQLGGGARCHRVGITGPPGVGKSSLVSVLARAARRAGRTVGVLAVDPSSPRSGGALLGDRARIEIDPDDDGLFVRSMASGGDLGGLARAAGAAVEVLSSAYDLVLVETTGVGQSETDVEHVADTVLMVIQPGSGDVLQFLKAGIIEIPDLFVVNKSDLGTLAERAAADLAAALSAVHGDHGSGSQRVLRTSASDKTGIVELLEALDERWRWLSSTEALAKRRAHAASRWAYRLFTLRYGEHGVMAAGGRVAVERALTERVQAGQTAVEAVTGARPPYA